MPWQECALADTRKKHLQHAAERKNSLDIRECGRLGGTDEEKVPAVVPYVHQNRGDRGTEPITKIAEGQGGKEHQHRPYRAMVPEVTDRKQ